MIAVLHLLKTSFGNIEEILVWQNWSLVLGFKIKCNDPPLLRLFSEKYIEENYEKNCEPL